MRKMIRANSMDGGRERKVGKQAAYALRLSITPEAEI